DDPSFLELHVRRRLDRRHVAGIEIHEIGRAAKLLKKSPGVLPVILERGSVRMSDHPGAAQMRTAAVDRMDADSIAGQALRGDAAEAAGAPIPALGRVRRPGAGVVGVAVLQTAVRVAANGAELDHRATARRREELERAPQRRVARLRTRARLPPWDVFPRPALQVLLIPLERRECHSRDRIVSIRLRYVWRSATICISSRVRR